MIISSKKDVSKSVLNINGVKVTRESSVKLFGIETDNKLNFEKHFQYLQKSQKSTKCNCRLQTFMGHKEKEAIINTFMHSNFNYGCLIWQFSSKKSQNKVEKFTKGV